MNVDGLSYLDLASEAQTSPLKLLNGLWSPAYPALISVAISLVHPSPGFEFPLVHVLNLLMFVFALSGFATFLQYCLASTGGNQIAKEESQRYIVPFAFCIFLWFTLRFIGMEFVTPDLGVAGIAFFAAALSCRLSLLEPRWWHYVALGLVLGVGYYLKAAMFPLGLMLLGILFFVLPLSNGMTRRKLFLSLCLSLSVFMLMASPLVAAFSVRAKAFSFGEAGRLNYAWHVNGHLWADDVNYPAPFETPEHPPRKLLTRPVTLDFTSHLGGTYPIWYDPSYWHAGLNVRFNLRQQIRALRRTLGEYKALALDSIAFISGVIVLLVFALHQKSAVAVLRRSGWQLVWPFAAFAMFALVHVESRYVGAFFVISFVAAYCALMFRVERRVTLAVSATVLCAGMIPFSAHIMKEGVGIAKDLLIHPDPPEYQVAALGLRDLGLKNGDRLAAVGYAFDCYYARYDRLRIAAQIPDADEFWHLSTPELKLVTERLASIGVKAVVAWNRPKYTSAIADWKDIQVSDSRRLNVLVLSPR